MSMSKTSTEDMPLTSWNLIKMKKKKNCEKTIQPGNTTGASAAKTDLRSVPKAVLSNKKCKTDDSSDESEDESDSHRLIESAICLTKVYSMDENLDPFKRFWVEQRPKNE